ncbi:MAG: hypothetical protein JNJ41_07035 [Bacteroidia bacterium]|nr:hypothetical protein [Bacteroidia bacterium]
METFNTFNTIEFLIKNWKKFAFVGAISIACSILLTSSLIIEPDYKSTFVVYPTNLTPFSKESGTEQLYQFLNSEEIKLALTKRFDLFKHYKIDATDEKAQWKFNKLYNSKFKIAYTQYQSIQVSVIDISPNLAKQFAEGMIDEVNKLIRLRKKEKYNEYVDLYARRLNAKKKEIDSLESKIKFMRVNYGLLDAGAQSKIISKKLAKKDLNETDKTLLSNLKEHSGEYAILQNRFALELDNYGLLKQSYDKNLTDFNGNLSYTTIVSYPNLPDKKNWPNVPLVVFVITFSSLLLTAVFLLLKEKRSIKGL